MSIGPNGTKIFLDDGEIVQKPGRIMMWWGDMFQLASQSTVKL